MTTPTEFLMSEHSAGITFRAPFFRAYFFIGTFVFDFHSIFHLDPDKSTCQRGSQSGEGERVGTMHK